MSERDMNSRDMNSRDMNSRDMSSCDANSPWQSCEERVLELLSDEATFGLTVRQQEELQGLLDETPNFDRECMERVAATVLLASVANTTEPMPQSLQRRVRAGARQTLPLPTDFLPGRRLPGEQTPPH